MQRDASYWREYNARNKIQRAKAERDRQREIRHSVVLHYGGKCECCLDRTIEFLAVEPITKRGGRGTRQEIHDWLRKEELPKGYRVLCGNCSRALRGGYCPHREATI